MKKLTYIVLILSTLTCWSQKEIKPTDGFTVEGRIKQEMRFNISDLDKFPVKKMEDVVITNHLGEKKGVAKDLKGILLKDILDKVEFNVESPKLLSEFFMTLVASDGYKVVYSWNEIFNTATGDNIYLITEKEGRRVNDMDDRILVITTTDFKTGRRNIKGLSKIIVGRVE